MTRQEQSFVVSEKAGEVSAILQKPQHAKALLVLAHGAGAGMHHPFMETICHLLETRGIATFRYQFPYMEAGKKRPDHRNLLIPCVRAAIHTARTLCPDLPTYAGGKSMGGRMTSMAASEEALPGVEGLVFLGFPLHPAGKPGTDRAEHLALVNRPMLFLQGTRDTLAGLDLLRPVCAQLPQSTLSIADGADHSFKVLKRSGRTDEEVMAELADQILAWIEAH